MSQRNHKCSKDSKCPCTREIEAAIPRTAEQSKEAILPTVIYLHDILQPITTTNNYVLSNNVTGLLTVEGSNINVNLGPFVIDNGTNMAILVRNSTNITISGGNVIGNILVENCNNIQFEDLNTTGITTINNTQFSYVILSKLLSTTDAFQLNNSDTCIFRVSTVTGRISIQNSTNVDINDLDIFSNSPNTSLFMKNINVCNLINCIFNGNNVGTRALTIENSNSFVVRLIHSKNYTDTHVYLNELTDCSFGEVLINGSTALQSNGVIASNCTNVLYHTLQLYHLSGDGLNLTNCNASVCTNNTISQCGRGIVVSGDGLTIQNNNVSKCGYGIVGPKDSCIIYFSNKSAFSNINNYKNVPHLTISASDPSVCELNKLGAFINISVIC
jgi:hypothetical protein